MDPKPLWKKTLAKAFKAPPNLVTGAVSLATSAALWNPLPLILWGLGSSGWLMFATSSQRFAKQLLDEERQAREAQAERDREVLRQRVEAMLAENPTASWTRSGLVPDYLGVYRRLLEIRARVAKVLADRGDLDAGLRAGILQQLGYMLTAYLNFVRERIVYLQIIATIRPAADLPSGVPPPPPPPEKRRDFRSPLARTSTPPAAPLPSVERRLAEVDDKVEQLKDLAEKEPATARTRQWHIGILEKQRDLLLECQKRDQMVVAQLGAFTDVFEVILGRVSASQFSATEVASYMGAVVEQVVETERFVDSLRPAMDQLVGGMSPV